MSERLAIFGDIHGEPAKLVAALSHVAIADRRFVFLGDFISRGRHSREVLDTLCELHRSSGDRHVYLRGNHEVALLAYLRDGDFSGYVAAGGLSVIHSYAAPVQGGVHTAFKASFPAAHLALIEQSRLWYEDETVFCSHAGPDPAEPAARSEQSLAHGHAGFIPLGVPDFGKLIVCGHYLQPTAQPLVLPHLVCLETGSGLPGGKLSVLLLPERQILQF